MPKDVWNERREWIYVKAINLESGEFDTSDLWAIGKHGVYTRREWDDWHDVTVVHSCPGKDDPQHPPHEGTEVTQEERHRVYIETQTTIKSTQLDNIWDWVIESGSGHDFSHLRPSSRMYLEWEDPEDYRLVSRNSGYACLSSYTIYAEVPMCHRFWNTTCNTCRPDDVELHILYFRNCAGCSEYNNCDNFKFPDFAVPVSYAKAANNETDSELVYDLTLIDETHPPTARIRRRNYSDNQMQLFYYHDEDPHKAMTLYGGAATSSSRISSPDTSSESDQIIPEKSEIPIAFNPNPFNSKVEILFEIEEESSVDIEIFDYMGKSIGQFHKHVLQAGKHNQVWVCENCPSGSYLVRVTTETRQSTARMILVK